MSNATEHGTEEHQSVIKTPRQLITVVVLAFIVPVVIIMMLVNYVTNKDRVGAGSDALTATAVEARIAPMAGFELVDASAPREFLTGDAVYQQVCAACHTAGVAGAPKSGSQEEWAPRLATGFEALVASTIHGKGAMPPKGGAVQLSDFEIERAVVYMTNQAGGDFPEPVEPATEEGQETAPDTTAEAAPASAAAPETATAAAEAPPAEAPAAEAPATDEASATAEAPAEAATAIVISPEAATVGKQLYQTVCMACHAAGVAGAPKTGNQADWAPYIAQGMDEMLRISITGKGAMPPRGGAANASDDQLRAAIEFMITDAL
ncbi:MAG: cytochrome c5 family protein [Pigmentiphaga sp.]